MTDVFPSVSEVLGRWKTHTISHRELTELLQAKLRADGMQDRYKPDTRCVSLEFQDVNLSGYQMYHVIFEFCRNNITFYFQTDLEWPEMTDSVRLTKEQAITKIMSGRSEWTRRV